jgi:hypothetical protein
MFDSDEINENQWRPPVVGRVVSDPELGVTSGGVLAWRVALITEDQGDQKDIFIRAR